jgi:hypothetical protein
MLLIAALVSAATVFSTRATLIAGIAQKSIVGEVVAVAGGAIAAGSVAIAFRSGPAFWEPAKLYEELPIVSLELHF